jgi:predicted small lipoprotein YifL
MVSHNALRAGLVASVLAAGLALAGCGIKGPLKLPPKPEPPPAGSEAPAPRSP